MSIDQQILSIERLAETDAQIKTLTEKVERERGEIGGVRDEVAQLEERLSTDGASVAEMEKTRADLLQEIRTISGQIDRSRERLQRSRNEREINAAERELDELRKIQRDRDDEIKKILGLTEQARLSIQEAEERKGELTERLAGSIEGVTKIISDLDAELKAAVDARAVIAKELPNRLLRRYESMHQRGKVPVAKTHDGTCLGCNVKLPPMKFHTMLSRLSFEECSMCHRIIYYEPPPTAEELAAKAAEEEAAADKAQAEEAAAEEAATEAASTQPEAAS